MEYMDIRVRMPISKLGTFIQMLPNWAQMIGYDKLKSHQSPHVGGRPRKSNGEYVPKKGSSVEAILKYMTEKGGPFRRSEVFNALKKKHIERALSSAFYQLRDRGLIQKQEDGSYVVKN